MVAKIIYVSCALLTGKTVKVDLMKPQVISCCFTKPLLPPPPPPHTSNLCFPRELTDSASLYTSSPLATLAALYATRRFHST